MRLLFAGTPEVAVPSLRALLAHPAHEVVAVLTRPQSRSGRGRRLTPSPVAELARQAGVEVLSPDKPTEDDFVRRLAELDVDCAPVVAYGALLREPALSMPRHGWVNLHFSLLPAWRGAAPVQHAVLHGDDTTGASTFLIGPGLDDGPVFGVLTERVRPRDTSGELLARLAEAGAPLLVATLDGIADGSLRPQPQPGDGVSHAPKLTVADARIDFGQPALAVDRRIRACTPDPGAWTSFRDGRLKLGPASPAAPLNAPAGPPTASEAPPTASEAPPTASEAPATASEAPSTASDTSLAPGELSISKNAVLVGTATTPLRLGDVQPAGKNPMPAADWARGLRLESGARLG